eukprot:CFRG1181T1
MALSSPNRFSDLYFDDDGYPTDTSQKQWMTEDLVETMFEHPKSMHKQEVTLNRKAHISYLRKNLFGVLPTSFVCLDASKPWICYWICHALAILGEKLTQEEKNRVIDYLSRCRNTDGGFGGGPQQTSHLAPTYAAINCLASLDCSAMEIIDRELLAAWLLSLKQSDGSFIMHRGGEVDVRGAYCAISVAVLCAVPKATRHTLFHGTAEWIARCQTYEGGFAGMPGCEAHGGYGYCGVAALCLLEEDHLLDLESLTEWAVHRQMRFEGGFQGRTNKLVDGCYSFWLGGIFSLINYIQNKRNTMSGTSSNIDDWMFNRVALQDYILLACQEPFGGCVDKPGKSRDFYHTCYVLSGLSVAQHYTRDGEKISTLFIGDTENIVETINPFHNITHSAYLACKKYYEQVATLEEE